MTGASQPPTLARTYDSLLRAVAAPPSIDDAAVELALALRPGAKVGSIFEIVEPLGVGGMGMVFRARDTELERDVALKVHRPTGGGGATARLLDEAKALARLSHPNVLGVHAVGREGEAVFLALEFVSGTNVTQWLEQGPRSWREVLAVYQQAGAGLAAIHDAGLAHRDFKPDNVMLGDDGRVRVADFGLAKTIAPRGELDLEAVDTMDDALAVAPSGTPAYAAPEQWAGLPPDARADQFSFCVAVYEGLYGHRPFVGDTLPELVYRMSSGAPAPPPTGRGVPGWIFAVLRRGLRPNPAERFEDLGTLLRELDPSRRARRRRLLLGGLVVAGGCAGLFAIDGDGPTCEAAVAPMHAVWDEDTRSALANAWASAEGWALAEPRIDRWTEAWLESRTSVCESAARGADPALTAQSVRCLDRAHEHFAAVIERLQSVDDRARERLATWIAGLPSVQRCSDPRALLATAPPPADPEIRDAVDALAAELRVQIRRRELEASDAPAADVEPLVDRARALAHAPPLAIALLELGARHYAAGRYPPARDALREAFDVALAGADPYAATEAATHLASFDRHIEAHPEQAQAWINTARALAQRLPGQDLRVGVEREAAAIANDLGRTDEARANADRALELQRALDPDSPRIPDVLTELAGIERNAGNQERFGELVHEVRQLTARIEGGRHPKMVTALSNEGFALAEAGRYGEARELLAQAETLAEDVGIESRTHLMLLERKAMVLLQSGDKPGGLEAARERIELAQRTLGPDNEHTQRAELAYMIHLNSTGDAAGAYDRGRALLASPRELVDPIFFHNVMALAAGKLEQWPDALSHARAAVAHARKTDDPRLERMLNTLARTQNLSGDVAGALASWDESFAIHRPGIGDRNHVGARIEYYEVIASDPARFPEAVTMALGAWAYLRDDTESDRGHRTRILRWLEEHASPSAGPAP